MSWRWTARLVLILAAILAAVVLPATMLQASLSAPDPASDPKPSASLAGQLLIATPSMGDPRFARTVILILKHDASGAFGLVINRPAGERPAALILEAFGEDSAGVSGTMRIFVGGPVEPRRGFVLHSPEYRRDGTMVVGPFAMTVDRQVFRDIAEGKGPQKRIVAFGYAGWAPGQLENELRMNAWYTAPADSQLVFDEDRDKVWDTAMARRPRDI